MSKNLKLDLENSQNISLSIVTPEEDRTLIGDLQISKEAEKLSNKFVNLEISEQSNKNMAVNENAG